jgi:hypothetical protein
VQLSKGLKAMADQVTKASKSAILAALTTEQQVRVLPMGMCAVLTDPKPPVTTTCCLAS